MGDRMWGILDDHMSDYESALKRFEAAGKIYHQLDRHLEGMVLRQQGNLHLLQGRYEETIADDERALAALDPRRDPLVVHVELPINLAAAFTGLRRTDEADEALSRCQFDRDSYPSLAGTEALGRACLALDRNPRRILNFAAAARERFEKVGESLNAALATTYEVEAHACLRDRARALDSCQTALTFFTAAKCPQETLISLEQLRTLLQAEELDADAIRTSVQRLTKKHGGWLPEP